MAQHESLANNVFGTDGRTADLFLSVGALAALTAIPVYTTKGVLVFLAFGLLLMAWRLRETIAQLIRFWPILLLPAFCFLSFIWSLYPAQSFRFGLQFALTVLIAITIATRISSRMFCLCIFWLVGSLMLASLLEGNVRSDTGAWLGVYGSKNALAGAAAVYVVVCFGLLMDARATFAFRIVALLGLLLGTFLLIAAQSVGAALIVIPTIIAQVILLVLPRLRTSQIFSLVVFAVLLSALAAVLVIANFDNLVGLLLDKTGKDLTLTGRTDLWSTALDFIRERPLFGIGFQAFWVQGHQPAETLWYLFGIDARSGFNFHNTYLSNAVEIGIVGVMLQVLILYGAVILTGIWTLRSQNPDASLLFGLVFMVALTSFVEVPIFFQFSFRSATVIMALVFAARGLKALRRDAD